MLTRRPQSKDQNLPHGEQSRLHERQAQRNSSDIAAMTAKDREEERAESNDASCGHHLPDDAGPEQ